MRGWARPLLAAALAAGLTACMGNVQPLDMTDAGIKARVETALRGQPNLELRYVTVDVNSRIATISGMVTSYQDKETITRIARRTKGVDQAIINLLVPE